MAHLSFGPGGADAERGGHVAQADPGTLHSGGDGDAVERRGRCRAARRTVTEVGSSKVTAAIRCLVNRERLRAGRSRVGSDRALNGVGRRQVELMIDRNCFGANCGPPLRKRVEDSGYSENGEFTVAELVARAPRAQATAKRVVAHWMELERKTLLRDYFRDIGIGVKRGLPGRPASKGGTFAAEIGCPCNRPAR